MFNVPGVRTKPSFVTIKTGNRGYNPRYNSKKSVGLGHIFPCYAKMWRRIYRFNCKTMSPNQTCRVLYIVIHEPWLTPQTQNTYIFGVYLTYTFTPFTNELYPTSWCNSKIQTRLPQLFVLKYGTSTVILMGKKTTTKLNNATEASLSKKGVPQPPQS